LKLLDLLIQPIPFCGQMGYLTLLLTKMTKLLISLLRGRGSGWCQMLARRLAEETARREGRRNGSNVSGTAQEQWHTAQEQWHTGGCLSIRSL
jgi:hypothetical protein